MNFGEKFSKVEYLLSESYIGKTFSEDIKKFQKLVLENKDLSKIYFLYSELSKEQGFDKSFAEEYVNESVSQIKELSKVVNRHRLSCVKIDTLKLTIWLIPTH